MPFYILSISILALLVNGCIDKKSLKKVRQKIESEPKVITTKRVDDNLSKLNKILAPRTTIIETNNTQEKENNDLINKEIGSLIENNTTESDTILLTTLTNSKIHVHLNNEQMILDEFKNKIIIIEFFTTWCPSCIESFSNLEKILKKYHKDIQVIGILMEENRRNSEIQKFKEKYNINYPVTNCKENYTLAEKWGGVSGYPTIIIFDRNGNYFNHYNGLPPYEMLKSDIIKVLRKK